MCVQGQSNVAFIMISLHFHKLVEKSLLGSPVWYVCFKIHFVVHNDLYEGGFLTRLVFPPRDIFIELKNWSDAPCRCQTKASSDHQCECSASYVALFYSELSKCSTQRASFTQFNIQFRSNEAGLSRPAACTLSPRTRRPWTTRTLILGFTATVCTLSCTTPAPRSCRDTSAGSPVAQVITE